MAFPFTDEAIAVLNDKFIPFAPRFAGPQRKSDWWVATQKDFFANNAEKLKLSTVPGTLFWTLTSAGQPVPAKKAKSSGKVGLAGELQQILQLYAELPAAQRRPDKPIEDANLPEPAPPAGGLVLVSFDRPLQRQDNGQYLNLANVNNHEKLKKHIPSQPGPQRDAFWLTAAECQSLVPKNPQKGQTFAVPALVTKRIGLFALTVRTAFQEFYLWKPDSIRQGELKLTVESVSPSAIQMRLHGSFLLTAEHKRVPEQVYKGTIKPYEERYDARLEGRLVYDLGQKRFTRWDMVALGDLSGFCLANDWPGYRDKADWCLTEAPVPIAMSFEIDNNNYELPAEYRRSTPFLIWRFGDYGAKNGFYFDPEKWEADWIKRGKK